MARTINEIQAQIIATIQADSTLSGLTSTSSTAIWRLITRVVAFAIAVLENLWDTYRDDVDSSLLLLKPHTARWYAEKARAFQYGFSLVDGEDYYDNTGIDPDTVAASQVVAQAAVVDQNGQLVIKANREISGDLEPLSVAQFDAFEGYMGQIKDAGIKVQILSFQADKLKLEIDVYYDPLVIGPDGARLDGTSTTPVKDAIQVFLRALPFDGEFVKAHLIDAIQAVDGVFVPEPRSCQATRFDSASFSSVDIAYQPYSGFLRIYDEADLTLNYIANV